ncbi:uncharacterized protein [Euphorbia lathyris]|uniref:uncharacterized protein isoform X2 n=1 Tax=Euphorbia lathyris TaxID=212925 RepID=UPI0033133756
MKKCELCHSPARMYCESDQASLCWDCDSKVHSANFLVAKHSRTLLCNICQSFTPWTASGPNLTPTASVCNNCITDSTCREEIRNVHQRNRDSDNDDDDDDDDNNREERDTDDDDDDSDGDGGGGGDEDDEENQVVPWSSTAPPPASSSSNSEQESYSNSDESSCFQTVSFAFKSSSSSFQNRLDFPDSDSISRPLKKNQKKDQIPQDSKKNGIWKQRRLMLSK